MTTSKLNEDVKEQLIREFASGDVKYTLPGIIEYINACTMHYKLDMQLVKMNVVYDPSVRDMTNVLQLASRVARRIQRLLFEYSRSPRKLTYYLVPMESPRMFPKAKEEITPLHINGAYTYRHNGTVYIYRLEEFPKVALHEACHHLPLHSEKWNSRALARL